MCAYVHVSYSVLSIMGIKWSSILKKTTLIHCVHIFPDMAPIRTVFQAPSRLTEVSYAVIQRP